MSVLGQRLIILNDARLAFELLEKKSVIYSDRPKLPFASLYAYLPSRQGPFSRLTVVGVAWMARF